VKRGVVDCFSEHARGRDRGRVAEFTAVQRAPDDEFAHVAARDALELGHVTGGLLHAVPRMRTRDEQRGRSPGVLAAQDDVGHQRLRQRLEGHPVLALDQLQRLVEDTGGDGHLTAEQQGPAEERQRPRRLTGIAAPQRSRPDAGSARGTTARPKRMRGSATVHRGVRRTARSGGAA
jgi:hypothetical protein